MAAPIKKIIHRFIYNISEYEPGGSQSNKVIPLDTQIYAYYPETYDKEVHDTGLYFVFGDGQHTYDEIRRGLGIYDASKEYGTYNPQEIAELKRMIEHSVPKNEHAVSGTGTKVTTDENGLVIDLTTLDQDDIPEIPLSKVYDVFASPEEINQLLGVTDNVQGQLDTLTQGLSTEVVTRIANVQTLTTNLSNEVTARTNADTNLQNQINSLHDNIVKYDENQGIVDKNNITLEGTGVGTKITNVAPGVLNTNSKDAVNGSQLYTTNQSVSDVARDLNDLSNVVDTKQQKLTAANAGDGISITGEGSNVLIANTNFSAIWGNIQGTLSDQTDLQNIVDDLDTRIDSNETNIGTLNSLTTDAKENLVSAINEVDSHANTNTTNIGTLSNLTTSEKNTIVSAINEVDSHTDTNTENIGVLNSLTTDEKSTIVGAINEVDLHTDTNTSNIGNLTNLTTENKTNIVSALNELDSTKQDNITGAATTILNNNLTKNRVVISNNSGKIAVSDITSTELNYLDNVTGNVQEQINSKVTKNDDIIGATHTKITYDSKGLVTNGENLIQDDIPSLNLTKIIDVTATAEEVNVLDGITTSTTELNYVDGVTSNIQDQLDTKVVKNDAITAATKTKITYDSKGLVTSGTDLAESDIPNLHLNKISDVTATANEVNVLHGITASTTELNYTDGVTSNIQDQLDTKVVKNDNITAGTHTKITYDSKGLVTSGEELIQDDIPDLNLTKIVDVTATAAEINVLDGITASTAELNYTDGVTSPIQDQLDSKVAKNDAITAGTHTKITYDTKGLVTGGSDIVTSDVTDLTATSTEINQLHESNVIKADLTKLHNTTATANELNILHGATLDTTELNYVDGVTSSIQTQINSKRTKIEDANKVYATDNLANQSSIAYDISNSASTIVQRDVSSQINVAQTPTANTHATSKKYVDDKISAAVTEAVVFKGIVADETELPSSGNTNGDMYWITAYSNNPPAGMVSGRSGAAIYKVTGTAEEWNYTQDTIYQPDNQSVSLNANGELQVMLSSIENNSVTKKVDGLHVDITGKVDKNTAITGATKCKITYDSKGLVTAGTDLVASDIPNLTLNKISDITATAAEVNVLDGITASTSELNYVDGVTSPIQTQIDSKVAKNDAITGATKCKITYDSKGLVTAGADLIPSDIPSLALTKISDVTATAEEVNILDGITASTTELNYVDGVTSPIQTQLDSKVIKNDAITGATHTKITYDSKGLVTSGTDLSASDIPSLTLDKISDVTATATEVNVLDGITASTVELNYMDGVTSSVQTQLDSKVAKNDDVIAATHTKITYDSKGLVTGGTELSASDIPSLTLSKISDITATAEEVNILHGITTSTTELNYVDGVTSSIQTQIDSKVAKNDAITAGTHTKITYDSKGLVTGGTELSASDIPSLTLDKISDVTATAAEVNVLDGITVSTTELNYIEGVTSSVQTQINNEISNRETAITNEATTRSTEDGKLSTAIANEKTRAEGVESNLNTTIGNEKTRAETAEGNLNTAITDEVTRATGAEDDLQDAITAEETAREDADTNLSNLITGVADDLADEITRASGVEDNLQDDIDTINGKIPSAASSSNKLVDNSAFTTELNKKVDKTTTGNVVYGTDENGDQTVHSIDSFGKVDDVKIGNTSLVTNKIASIPLAGNGTVGVASFANANGLNVDANGAVSLVAASQQEIVAKTETKKPITPSNLAYAIEKGLGANGLTWTDQEKSSARSTIGAQATITGAATTITSNDLTTDRVIVSNVNGKIVVSDITTTELGYLDDATSNIQQQINSLNTNKVNKNNAIIAGTATRITYDTKGLVTAGANDLTVSDITDLTASATDINVLTDTEVTNTELSYVHGVTESIQDQLTTLSSELDAEIDARETVDQTQGTYISNIQAVIPPAATSSNQLADKEYVNDLVQSTAADFRGSWNTYADVPTNSNLYPEDETGSRIPNINDYIIIQRDETQDGGTWRYKYTGVWATDNKAGWTAEYEINANPLTQDQIAALDSGITDVLVAQISTNEDDITALSNSKQNNITGAASSVTTNNLDPSVVVVTNSQGKLDDSNVSVTELGYLSGVTSSIQTQLNGKQSNLSATQLNAVNSGITEVLRQSYDAHVADTDIHVTTQDKTNWSAKQEALNTTQMNAVNSGITTALREGYDTHVADTDIHITTQERTTWNAKQNAISDLSDIRSGAAAGATAVQDVTVNGTSIVSNKSATIPLAAINGDYGLVKLGAASYGIAKNTTNNFLYLNAASSEDITAKTSAYKPIVPSNLDNAVKTSVTTNTNTLTDNEKAAAQTWLGVDTELAKKQNNLTGAATTIASSNLTASRALISNASGKVAVSDITSTELSYLDGVTSNIQTQLGNLGTNKADKATTLAGYGITDAYTKTEVDEKIAGVYIYKGSVATESDLPATGNRTGDIYNVESDGTNWAWNGTAWDNLGALIDLSVKQDVLVSGTNIKTVNNNSILGSGNLSLPTTIASLDDTTISTASDGQFLVYDSTTSKWKNITVHIPNDANNATITIKDAANTTIGDFTTDQSSAETITIPTATKTALGLVKVDDALSSSSTNPVQNKVINTALSGKQANLDTDQLAAVNSGINSTLVGKITTNESAISTINNSDVMTSGITPTLVTTYSTHVSNSNIHVTSDQKLAWTGKQDALVSGTNIKTINNTSILGSGNIDTHEIPSQTGNSGKFLTTNGSAVSWGSIGLTYSSSSETLTLNIG